VTDQPHTLTALQVDEAGLPDWRALLGRVKARFRTPDLATGAALVAAVVEAAGAAGRDPEVVLTGTDVVVALPGNASLGVTAEDLAVARRVSARAAELGARADPGGITQLEIGLDTAAGPRVAPFYTALLGSELRRGEPVDPSGQVPTLWWQGPGEPDDDALPERDLEQRWHLDVWVARDEAERRLRAALDAGGRMVSDAAAPAYWVIEDTDGNRSCICSPAGR
jgi:4a-hydroxytetrahydrobiopterin dehydratase